VERIGFRGDYTPALTLALTSLFLASPALALSVTPTGDANVLAAALFAGEPVSTFGASYTGASDAAGTYTDGGVVGIESGILLTSGEAASAPGPNTDPFTSGQMGTAGDVDLDGLLGGLTTVDASVLEMSFSTSTGGVFLDFAFGSEEYNEFAASNFNDVMGIWIDGFQVALIDGDIISINTVNCGEDGLGGPNCAVLNNNDPLLLGVPTPFDIEYDAFTNVLRAELDGLGTGSHTLKIAIADTLTDDNDSAVFVKGGALGTQPAIPEPGSAALFAAGSLFVALNLSRRRR